MTTPPTVLNVAFFVALAVEILFLLISQYVTDHQRNAIQNPRESKHFTPVNGYQQKETSVVEHVE